MNSLDDSLTLDLKDDSTGLYEVNAMSTCTANSTHIDPEGPTLDTVDEDERPEDENFYDRDESLANPSEAVEQSPSETHPLPEFLGHSFTDEETLSV